VDTEQDASAERFAANLRAAREAAGLSHGDLAALMRDRGFDGFRRQTVQRIESLHRSVSVGEAYKLAQCLGADLYALLLRPEPVTAEGLQLLQAMRRLRQTGRGLQAALASHADARAFLERAVARAAASACAAELASEIQSAERALKEDGDRR
jgi:transcriptional regulator with XRE-family HTH domain